MRWLQKLCLNTTLVAANLFFFAIASWLLVEGSKVRKAGWLDVFEDDYPWFHTAYVLTVVFLSVLVGGIAISGLYSVLFKRKPCVLAIYASCTLITAALCAFLAIEGGISLSAAHSWKSRVTVEPSIEGHVQTNFNTVYCLAQAGYLCTASASAQWLVRFGSDDVRDLFLSADISSTVKRAMAMERSTGRNLLQMCEDETSSLHVPVMDPQVANLCTWCGDIADLKTYSNLVSWANSKCPPKKTMASFCTQNVWLEYSLSRGDLSIDTPSRVFYSGDLLNATEPYVQCRKTFLSYWSYLSLWFLVFALLMLTFMVVVMRISWVVLRLKKERYNDWHGRKPERKPLVQMTTKSKTGTPTATSATTAPPTTKSSRTKK